MGIVNGELNMANHALLDNTLKLIKENPRHWNQERWHCGTSHCFAGFVELQVKGLPVNTFLPDNYLTKHIAMDALGINVETADTLFYPYNSLETLERFIEEIKAGVSISLLDNDDEDDEDDELS